MVNKARVWCEASVSEYGGGAMCVGTGWCATDGVEDAHRVRQSVSCTVLYWINLEKKGQIGILGKAFYSV